MSPDDWFRLTLEASIGGGFIVLVVLAIQYLGTSRLSPRMLYMFWFLLIARLVLPWTPESPTSIFNFMPNASSGARDDLAGESILIPDDAVADGNALPAIDSASNESETPKYWPNPLSTIWILGTGLFLVHVGYTSVRTARSFRTYQPVTDTRVNVILQECKTLLDVKADTSVVTHDRANGAVLFGILRPRIAIARHRLDSLSDDELRHLFLHELAHWKRGDIPVAWLATLLQAVHWFNPIVWYGFYRMRLDREIVCDALALSHLPASEAHGYGHTLLKLVHRPTALGAGASVVSMAENTSQLKRRITMISRHTSQSYRISAFGLALIAICGCVFLTDAIGQEQASDSTEENAFPHFIPIETYSTSWSGFQPGDAIYISAVWGTAPDFKEGERYLVKGSYKLASKESAMLHVYATDGRVESTQGTDARQGTGTFEREFKLVKDGMPHVSYYPANGGDGFGGVYFRKKPTASSTSGSRRDLSIHETEFTFRDYSQEGLNYLVATVRNTGTEITPAFQINFYLDDPDTPPMHTAVGASLSPGESWKEASAPFRVKPGLNTFYIAIDPENLIAETDESNNQASLPVRIFIGGANGSVDPGEND